MKIFSLLIDATVRRQLLINEHAYHNLPACERLMETTAILYRKESSMNTGLKKTPAVRKVTVTFQRHLFHIV